MKSLYKVGIDIGSTTSKIVVLKKEEIVYQKYIRHYAKQKESVVSLLNDIKHLINEDEIKICVTGSGSKIIADQLEIPFTQEVVSNALAIKKDYKKVRTAIELGGEDAKIIFFRENNDHEPEVFDMRMNGSCAGGTGAFIDETAKILNLEEGEINKYAKKGNCVYDVSGRCGVFAKTDIQSFLNRGANKQDIALSIFHAIAKQTIGGLAQGLDIVPPIIFEGGPLTFNPKLVEVFSQRLNLSNDDVVKAKHPEMMMALGAALSIDKIHVDSKTYKIDELIEKLNIATKTIDNEDNQLYFENKKEYEEFINRHKKEEFVAYKPKENETVNCYLGIDSGSTTIKFVLINENEEVIESFYESNKGKPLDIARNALLKIYDKYKKANSKLNIISSASTGYGELLFSKAFKLETHVVETIAHTIAAGKYVDNPSFILDIGGQDMKAIWLKNGLITNIVINEACSSGCGSFLENFANNFSIENKDIATRAFASKNPAKLGSRCTVFMNSSIVSEQRNGKNQDDIMAGLCRSIIENVFTKVIRIANIDSLGEKIVVQGGTFKNDAVLRAMEQYLNKNVVRLNMGEYMGAIGAALIAKEYANTNEYKKTMIDEETLKNFSHEQISNLPCPFCTNHCKRTVLKFSTGNYYVTNNRCEKGEIITDINDENTKQKLIDLNNIDNKPINMFDFRKKLLVKDYHYKQLLADQKDVIGIPRVLNFYEEFPFWNTFFKSLGFKVVLSNESTRKMYEDGLYAVPSDTACFPAKLVHGHIRQLITLNVDRIFMPSISVYPPDNGEKSSFSRCALVKGYPIIIKNSDNPNKLANVKFDMPYFFWYTFSDRKRQLCKYMYEEFGIDKKVCAKAVKYADLAQKEFENTLKKKGKEVIEKLEKQNRYGIVLSSRPYANDSLVNHELPEFINSLNLDVLTVDSLPNINKVSFKNSLLDISNNYHARVISGAVEVGKNPHLEMIQIISFCCGHDAILSDEAIRIIQEMTDSTPLVLKLDESDVQGPLRIRVRSYIETINRKRLIDKERKVKSLNDPYPVKFNKQDKKRIVLAPNSSHAFSQIMTAAFYKQGIEAVSLPVGKEEAIKYGKLYTNNDVCFPAQITIGEIILALKSGKYDINNTAVGMAKMVCCCRLTHYSALLRKALDDAGYKQVPIITNDMSDIHNMHPGYRMNIQSMYRVMVGMAMFDIYEEMLRKIRPYELHKGDADKAFNSAMDLLTNELKYHGIIGAIKAFKKGLKIIDSVKYNKEKQKPKVLIVGEFVLNFHPGANHEIERYLEDNGFEIVEAKMTDVIHKHYFCQEKQVEEEKVHRDLFTRILLLFTDSFFASAIKIANLLSRNESLHEKSLTMEDMAKESTSIIDKKFDTGEGLLIPAEIIHQAKKGCKNFVILQPFGCIPNHVIGRGVTKKLKELYPDIEILALDYDPDVSFANIENRIQMMIVNQKYKDLKNEL